MSKNNTKDALGNEIILGNTYGYNFSRNGVTSIKIGTAECFTLTDLVTIDVLIHKVSLYNGEAELSNNKTKISVKPAQLFPIDREIKI